MKKISLIISLCLFVAIHINAQTTTFDNLNANNYVNKAITWNSSDWGSGFGHRIINSDPGGQTLLNFQARHSTATWSDVMTITSTGNIGVGTSNPTNKLYVKGDGSTNQILNIHNPSTANGAAIRLSDSQWNSVIKTTPNSGGVSENLDFIVGANLGMRINENGRVGIGTTTPDAKLAVKGSIHSNEVKVDLLGAVAPDYVFYKDYDLKTLNEVENYITKEGHLPNIPSAKEMEANGLLLKEMNLKLLEKIEELMLYTIQQEKEINTLKKQASKVEVLEERLQKIEVLLKSKN
ncbi:tail fiber protein [Wocania ichthyoenteri]|uniref:tail fiber protein n=1 Tax=Wocania ichthyoenteri TaxID=1230531 RepID=UPI000691F4DE|nr:tail fiber protein [Wocania ichthyoenteri]